MSPATSSHVAPTPLNERFERLPIGDVFPSKTNPRTHFSDAYLEELAGSIREKDLIQPILVRPRGTKGFEIVAGECRYRASKLASRTHIASVIRDYTDDQVLELQLIENIHRMDLTPLEQAAGYRKLITSNPDKHSAESIASRIGMSVSWVWDRLKLNDLIPEAKKILEQDLMTVGHAILIARLKPEDQERAINPVINRSGRDGLWEGDHARLDYDEDDDVPVKGQRKPGKYEGLKAVSIRELERWIQDHVRFDAKHMAHAVPLQFEPTAAAIDEAAALPGRGKKIISITHEYRVADDARDDKERTYGSQSWERADGKSGSKTCEHSVLGVVAAGRGYGDTLQVCIARDRCKVHFGAVIKQKEKSTKLRESGQPSAAKKSDAARARAEQREREKRAAKEARWKVFFPALRTAVTAAAGKQPASLPKALFARVLQAHGLPANTTPANLQRALLADAIRGTFRNYAWEGDEPKMVAWAKLLGVDVKACEPKAAAAAGTRGVCQKCGCTEKAACPGGCSWVNAEETLCSSCVTPAKAKKATKKAARK